MDADIGYRHEQSIERAFEAVAPVPAWWEQVTLRSLAASLVLGTVFSFVAMRLQLSSGLGPSLSMSAALLGFSFIKTWTSLLSRFGFVSRPFTRQENTVVQTCIIACCSVSFSGGFGTYALAMGRTIANKFSGSNDEKNILDLTTWQWMAFTSLTSFVGLFGIVPLRKIMIIDYNLMYPSGFVTGHLINSFHTPQGAIAAKLQVSALLRSFTASFLWSLAQWFYTAANGCGFKNFPMFGLEAYSRRFYFDFSASFVGLGMICPSMVTFSLFVGSIISWGLLYPFIQSKKGNWYTDESDSNLRGMNGYKVLIGTTIILTDGLFHLCVIIVRAIYDVYNNYQTSSYQKNDGSDQNGVKNPYANMNPPHHPAFSYDDRRRTTIFLKDQIPNSVAAIGYVVLAAITIYLIPHIYGQPKYLHLALVYIFAPVFAFCNSYGSGLTDWTLSSTYGKIAIIVIGLWVGEANGGIVAGLVACGVMMGVVSTAADLMQDFRAGYLTLTSPRSMFVSQVIGTVFGCIINPIIFEAFLTASERKGQPLGKQGSTFPAPLAVVYRAIAISGFMSNNVLPKHCVRFCVAASAATLAVNVFKMVVQQRKWTVIENYIPSMMAMAVPFFVGPYIAIDMCLGSVILYMWSRMDRQSAEVYAPVVSSGLVCGDGIWQLPASILAILNVRPPICMKFLSADVNKKVDKFLGS